MPPKSKAVPKKRMPPLETERELQDAVEVSRVKNRPTISTGRPRKILSAGGMRSKLAFPAAGGFTGGSGGNFYSIYNFFT